MLPPAIAAAVFTTIAIVPPGGAPARGLRVEQIEGPVDATHPALVRAAVEDALASQWEVPSEVTFRVRDGERTIERRVTRVRGVPYAFATVPVASGGPHEIVVEGDGYVARAPLSSHAPAPFVAASGPRGEHGIDVRVEGGALVPEVPGTVLVRVPSATDGDVQLTSTDDALQIAHPLTRPDLCGICAFEATVRGLDAHVIVQLPGTGPDATARRALPVAPGGIAAREQSDSIEFTTPIGGQPLYVLTGDAAGSVLSWDALRFDDANDTNASLRIAIGPAEWIFGSLSPVFDQGTAVWTRTPPTTGCTATPLGDRFARTDTSTPPAPRVRVIFDGARIALGERQHRQEHARTIALALATAAIAMLLGLIVAASARRDPAAMKGIALSGRQRAWIALVGSAALIIGGIVLVSAFVMRR